MAACRVGTCTMGSVVALISDSMLALKAGDAASWDIKSVAFAMAPACCKELLEIQDRGGKWRRCVMLLLERTCEASGRSRRCQGIDNAGVSSAKI